MAKRFLFILSPYRHCIGRTAGRLGSSGVSRAALALLAGLVIAGCGSYTKADYVQRAEGICTSTLDAVRRLAPPDQSGSTAHRDSSLTAYLNRVLPLMQRQLKRLRALPRPSQSQIQERALNAYLAGLRSSVAQFIVLTAAARSSTAGVVNSIAASLATEQLSRLARAYGLKTCSSSGATYG